MGTAPSKPAPEFREKQRQQIALVEEARDLAEALSTLDLYGIPTSESGSLERSALDAWERSAAANPVISLSRTVLSHADIHATLLRRQPTIKDAFIFNTTLPYTPGPITNQLSSGRCWLFASTNVLRYNISQHPKLALAADAKFQLSQSYLFFYDKLEKANYYLENSIDLADLPLDDRLVQYLSRGPLSDGGQFRMVSSLWERYGVVPQAVYPESFNSSNSGKMNSILTTKVREHALRLRKLDHALTSSEWHVRLQDQGQVEKAKQARVGILRKKKEEFMGEIYNIMTICLGVPPSPTATFTWEYYDKNKKARSWTGTPLGFYKEFAETSQYKPSEGISLINDPRNEYEKLYTVDRLGNIWGGEATLYVNTKTETLKESVVKCIRAGYPVFFGCDVGKFSDTPLGIMDSELFDYEKAFGVKLGLSKAERLQTSESAMTHAMVITAVHVDEKTQLPIRYKVENSWGSAVGDEGFFVMTDNWFDEFVYQVVTPRHLAEKRLVDILDAGDATVLPAWDPMGALA